MGTEDRTWAGMAAYRADGTKQSVHLSEFVSAHWQTPTQLDGAGRDYTYPNGNKDNPFLTLTGQARGGMRQGPSRRLNHKFVAWLMGFPPDWCDEVPRVDALRCLGNAVVPAQGEYAIRLLWDTLTDFLAAEEATP